MKRAAIAVLLTSLAAGFLCGTTWNAGYEADPDDTDLAADIDNFIRDVKLEVRRRASVETIYGTGSNDSGMLRLGAARCYMQNGAPTDIVGPGAYVSSSGTFTATTLGTNEPGGTIDIGTGRCWIDLDGLDGVAGNTDDNQLNTWIDTVGWVAATATPTSHVGQNLIYNGSFEITDGTGNAGSAVIPIGWTVVGAPTFTYTDPVATSEGEGIAVNIVGVGANSGIQQTLASLKAGTAYLIRARVNPTTAGDICNLNVTGGAVSPVTDTSSTGTGVFELLEANVTTTAGAAPLVVQLRSTAATDVCRWDHVSAFEARASVSQPGIQVIQDDTSGAADINLASDAAGFTAITGLLDLSVTIPGPGYIIRVTGEAALSDGTTGGTTNCGARLRETVAGVTKRQTTARGNSPASFPTSLSWVEGTTSVLVPGTTFTYRLEIDDADDAGGDRCGIVTAEGGAYLRVELVPTR